MNKSQKVAHNTSHFVCKELFIWKVFTGLCYLNNKLELFKPLLKKHLLHFLLFMWFSLTVILFSAADILYFLQ